MDDALRILGQLREEPWTPFPEAVDLLQQVAPEGVPALLDALHDPQRRIRAMATRALGAFEGDAVVAALIRRLEQDTQADVRRVAVGALAECGGEQAEAALLHAYQEDSDLYTRIGAAHALALLHAPAAVPAFSALLTGDEANPWLLGETALALAELGDPAALDPLLATLDHPDPDVRGKAATALGQLGDPAAISALQATYANPTESPYVQALAQEALLLLGVRGQG